MLTHVKLINGGTQMESANIKSKSITIIKKIHDDHIEEDRFFDDQPEEPINNIFDEQPEQPQE